MRSVLLCYSSHMAICETCECVFEPKRWKSGRFCSGQCYWARGPDASRKGTSGRITTAWDHPLAPRTGRVAYSRLVLYDKIGPGPHPCHWCGKLVNWTKGIKSNGLIADHLDWDPLNDEPDNLVPACNSCNVRRAAPGRRGAIQPDEPTVLTGGFRTRAVERQCEMCGKAFVAAKSATGRFCSRECRIENMRRNPIKNNPRRT